MEVSPGRWPQGQLPVRATMQLPDHLASRKSSEEITGRPRDRYIRPRSHLEIRRVPVLG